MRLLLDTHILLAVIDNKLEAFGPQIGALLKNTETEFVVSAASLWEIAIKRRLGKLTLTVPIDILPSALDSFGIELLSIHPAHVLADFEPKPPTRDPFDRLLLAQCSVEGLRLVTADRALIDHPLAAAN
ncbi:type II toxin-antitoxin system VapC family toxin [Methylocystis parvus]|uniref:Type II toxin-antitoxin system VapC family toxin n=1 Tax=Methylocystis parvus TaxID=134 RepID=A0A6B8LVL8_9HYPH|nr:type II toxin-antitoxin system VapC family toxin [Methylocystis parvus]QGM96447.1 type II toxin-antitoxin system VapC family toxin [Methylocystis parvus]WBJ99704.1 type II toxin-antitoxin system VapC family toxin [Methylocystis parvus OBBP]